MQNERYADEADTWKRSVTALCSTLCNMENETCTDPATMWPDQDIQEEPTTVLESIDPPMERGNPTEGGNKETIGRRTKGGL